MRPDLKHGLTWRVLTNAGWASAATPIHIVLGIIQTGMLARLLGPGGIGIIAILTAACTFLGGVFKITSAEAAIVYVTKAIEIHDESKASHIIKFCFLLDFLTSLLAFLVIVIVSLYSPRVLNLAANQKYLLMLFGLTVIFQSTYWTSHALLRVVNRFSWTFYQSVGLSIIRTSLITVLFLTHSGLVEVVSLTTALAALDGLSMYCLCNAALRNRGLLNSKLSAKWWHIPGEVWRFQILGHARQLIKLLNRSVDILMMGYIGSPIQVGFYRSGKQIADQVNLPAQGLLVSLFPEYSRLYFSGNAQQLRKLVGRFTILFLGLGLLASLILWFGADWIIKIILGSEFLPAGGILRILMFSAVIVLLMSPVYSLPAAVGQAGPALWSVALAITVQVLLIIWLVPQKGALGAAWSNVAYFFTWALVLLPSIIRVLRGPPDELREEVEKTIGSSPEAF